MINHECSLSTKFWSSYGCTITNFLEDVNPSTPPRLPLRLNDLKARLAFGPRLRQPQSSSSGLTLRIDKLSALSVPKEVGLGAAEWVKSLLRRFGGIMVYSIPKFKGVKKRAATKRPPFLRPFQLEHVRQFGANHIWVLR